MKLIPCYINLDRRTDRKLETEEEFRKLDIQESVRFPAIYNYQDGAIGCLESHINVLENYDTDSPAIWVCEDDVQFLVNREVLDIYINEFIDSSGDILCLGFNLRTTKSYSNIFLRAFDTQTASSYIIKASFRKVLLNFWKSLLDSIKNNTEHQGKTIYDKLPIWKSPIYTVTDQSWKVLQQEYIFLVPNQRVLIQRPSYSDIEKHHVAYNR